MHETIIDLDSLRRSRGDYTESIGLPPEVYSDAQFHRFELDAVFGTQWLCVGRADRLVEAGDFVATSAAGEPIIVVRTVDGIHAMSAVCQHRGMCVTADLGRGDDEMFAPPQFVSGHGRNFRCPYHHWVFDLDGRLTGAPDMDRTIGFDKADIALPHIRTEIWQGFVFVNFDDDAAPLAPTLTKFDEVLVNHHLDRAVTVDPAVLPDLPFNWKIMVENFMEMYHNSRLHRGIHDFAPSAAARYEEFETGDGVMFGFTDTVHPDGGFNPTHKALFPILPDLTDDERSRVVFAFVPPTLLIGLQPDSAFWFTVDPTGPTTHTLSMAYLFPPETTELALFGELLEAAIGGVSNFNRQDMPTNVAVQIGMQSRFAPRGRYSWQEGVLASFNTWLVDRYEAAVSAPAGER